MTSEGNKDINISAGSDQKTINVLKNKSAQFINLQVLEMTINNPYETIIIETQLGQIQPYIEIADGNYEFYSRYIYYTYKSSIPLYHDFIFDITSIGMKYNVGIGKTNFISKPTVYILDHPQDIHPGPIKVKQYIDS